MVLFPLLLAIFLMSHYKSAFSHNARTQHTVEGDSGSLFPVHSFIQFFFSLPLSPFRGCV